jgi:hypothetical protein
MIASSAARQIKKHATSGCVLLFKYASNCLAVVGGDARPRLNFALRRLTARNSAPSLLSGRRSMTRLPFSIVFAFGLVCGM